MLLPSRLLLRRADEAPVIGAALTAAARAVTPRGGQIVTTQQEADEQRRLERARQIALFRYSRR